MKSVLLFAVLCLSAPLFGQGMTAQVNDEKGGTCNPCPSHALTTVTLAWDSPVDPDDVGGSSAIYSGSSMSGESFNITYKGHVNTSPYILDRIYLSDEMMIEAKRNPTTGVLLEVVFQGVNIAAGVELPYSQTEADVMDALDRTFKDILASRGSPAYFVEGISAIESLLGEGPITYLSNRGLLALTVTKSLLEAMVYQDADALDRFLIDWEALAQMYY
ncbi:MAG: hypothetical protein QNK37_32320 [Acidobacteriota bacterium]|nr:hypothetical protein [Acidobacteriota bacterium]